MPGFVPEISSASMLMLYFGFKIIRYFSFYLALYLATGYMSQIYVEKVYIDNENPPKLIMSAVTTSILEVIFLVIIAVVGYILFTVNIVQKDVLTLIMIDGVFCILLTFLVGWIISSAMYNRKIFAYREEGLRAIRAYEAIMRYEGLILNVLPFGIFVVGSIYVIGKV